MICDPPSTLSLSFNQMSTHHPLNSWNFVLIIINTSTSSTRHYSHLSTCLISFYFIYLFYMHEYSYLSSYIFRPPSTNNYAYILQMNE